jgi:Dolichyl-phosphate-mannose-protein mannosyltransferase
MTSGGRLAAQRNGRDEETDPWLSAVAFGPGADPRPHPRQEGAAPPSYSPPWMPKSGWTAAPSWRRTRVSRAILLGILLVQALLSLRLSNTAFEDEALYLYVGHLQLDHLLHGTPVPPGFTSYFSGSPTLYPVLAAAVESTVGLAGARALSLVFMLGATALVYSLTRLLFNERAGLCAAAAFATTQSTLFLGNFATYDALAIFLLALAAWIVVRTAHTSAILGCLLAAPVAALAVAVKYAALMFLPTVVVLAMLAAFPHRRWGGMVLRAVLLPAVTAAILAGALALAGDEYLRGVRFSTTARAAGNTHPLAILLDSLQWGGGFLALSLLGMVSYARRERMGEVPGLGLAAGRGRLWRLALGVLLCGSTLLAPAYQMHLHTSVSLHKHLGYGLLFAAPIAGVGMSRLVGAHFRYPQLAILVWVTLLTLGMSQSQTLYHAWADSSRMVATLESQLKPGGRYLVEADSVPIYYLRTKTTPDQWVSTYTMTYEDRTGRWLDGEGAFRAAIGDAYFDVIVLDRTVTKKLDDRLVQQLRANANYRLLAKLPFRNSYGSGFYQIWVKR